jgi:hypothetical protein
MLIWSPTANATDDSAGIVKTIALFDVKLISLPTSVSAAVYAVPAWVFSATIDVARMLAFAAVNTSPLVKLGLVAILLLS